MSELPREKPGPKTSEFWVTLVAPLIYGILKAYAPWIPEGIVEWAMGAAISYIVGRSGLKVAQAIGESRVAVARIKTDLPPTV